MPIFLDKNGEKVETNEGITPIPEGWGQLISRSYRVEEKFNLDNMFCWFRGTPAELETLATSAYENALRSAEVLGQKYGLDAEQEARKQAGEWYTNSDSQEAKR